MFCLAFPVAAGIAGAAAQPADAALQSAPPAAGVGGPLEHIPIVVTGKWPPAARSVGPDPRLERRYAPRVPAPVNRVTVRF